MNIRARKRIRRLGVLHFTSNILGSKPCLEAKLKQFDGSQPLPIFSGSCADTGLDLKKGVADEAYSAWGVSQIGPVAESSMK